VQSQADTGGCAGLDNQSSQDVWVADVVVFELFAMEVATTAKRSARRSGARAESVAENTWLCRIELHPSMALRPKELQF